MEHGIHLEGVQGQYKLPKKWCLLILNVGLDVRKKTKVEKSCFFKEKSSVYVWSES